MKETAHTAGDADLMERIARGDMRALGEVYQRYAEQVLRVARRLVPELPDEDVEDICQDVFTELPSLSSRYEERGKLGAWLIGIAVRKARAKRRKEWLRRSLLRRRKDDLHSVGRPAEDGSLRHAIQDAFVRLPQKYREVLVLHVIEGMDAAEIGELLGLSAPGVWTRLHRARKALAKEVFS